MLIVEQLHVAYGQSEVIRGISFDLQAGETLAVMGRNGMGKTTLLKAMIGMLPVKSGSIRIGNTELTGLESYKRVKAGMAYVPQGRMIFPHLSVEENILSGMGDAKLSEVPPWIYQVFPALGDMRQRQGGNLSGGQQQQLAISRALVGNPKVLILDEPTEGIQPSIIKEIARTLVRLQGERGFAMLVSEQVLSFALEVADRFLIIERGEFVHEARHAGVDAARIQAFLTI